MREKASEMLTVAQVLAELSVARATFYRWRQLGVGPRGIKLPNGQVRVRRGDLEDWLREHEDRVA